MRWPWRRRGGGRVVFIGGSPFDAVVRALPTPSPVAAVWIPDEPPAPVVPAPEPAVAAPAPAPPPPVPAPAPPPAPPSERIGVQLGFADGTVMTLADDDPRAVALRAAAARLTG